MPGPEETLKNRVSDLETALNTFQQRLETLEKNGAMQHRDIVVLSEKMDGIREDLRELKSMGTAFVPRQEFEMRLANDESQIHTLQESFNVAQRENHAFQIDMLKNLHSNTTATYGTLIMGALSFAGLIITVIGLFVMHK